MVERLKQSEFWRILEDERRGVPCPCCGRWAQIYKHRVNQGICLALIAIWRERGATPVNIAKDFPTLRSVTVLKHWGLICEVEPPEDAMLQFKNASPRRGQKGSWWQITPRGKRWVQGNTSIPRYAWLYNDAVHGGFSKKRFTIRSALRTYGFDYEEMLSGETLWQELELNGYHQNGDSYE